MNTSAAIIIGAGHNGLIAAAYLAKAGVRVTVLERRPIPGGGAATEEMAPGVRVNRGHADHVLLHTTPILEELGLAAHGLEHLAIDPFHCAPRLNDHGLVFWQDVDRTADAIGTHSARDARAYRTFVRQWGEMFQWLQPALLGDPAPGQVARRMLRSPGRTLAGLRRLPLWQRARTASMRDLLDATFEHMHLKGVLAFATAAAVGQSPTAPGSALFALAAAVPHLVGVRRPRGGSGALVSALVNVIEAHGGRVRTDAEVHRILVEDGAVRGVQLKDAEDIAAPTVVAGCAPQTTFLRLLDHQVVPSHVRAALERVQVASGFALKVDYVLDRLPEWSAHPAVTGAEQTRATSIICPSLEYLEAAFADYQQQRSPRWPALRVSTPSSADAGFVREGRHLLSVEVRYAPYQLDGGVSWHAVRQQEGERLFTFLQQYAPNLAGAEQLRIVQTPEDLERDFGWPRAHPWHLDAIAGQLLHRRPAPGLGSYRTPIRGLYLTGAGTHPGGGVWGAPGRNAAHVVLADLA